MVPPIEWLWEITEENVSKKLEWLTNKERDIIFEELQKNKESQKEPSESEKWELSYDRVSPAYDHIFSVVKKWNKYWYVYANTWKEILPVEYDNIDDFPSRRLEDASTCRWPRRVQKWGKRWYINNPWEIIIPLQYDHANVFSEWLAVVEKNWKYGFVDESGKEIIPLEYSYAWNFYNWLADVYTDNGEAFYISPLGVRVKKE